VGLNVFRVRQISVNVDDLTDGILFFSSIEAAHQTGRIDSFLLAESRPSLTSFRFGFRFDFIIYFFFPSFSGIGGV